MATNIEINYYNGISYEILYPYVNLANSTGSITSSQIPNLDMSKITSGNLASSRISGNINAYYLSGYTYSQVIANAKGIKSQVGEYKGTGASTTVTLSTSFLPVFVVIIARDSQGMPFLGSSDSSYSASQMLIAYNGYINSFEEWKTRITSNNGESYQRIFSENCMFSSSGISFTSNSSGQTGNYLNKRYNWVALG